MDEQAILSDDDELLSSPYISSPSETMSEFIRTATKVEEEGVISLLSSPEGSPLERGAAESLENTLTAFQHAISVGTQMLELDVQITADKKVVVCHDNDLRRVTGMESRISDLNYEDLPPLKEQVLVQFCPGITSYVKNNDRQIPLLSSVFEAFPDCPINLDIKRDSDELIDKTHELICQYNRKESLVWGNVNNVVQNKCYKKDPEIPVMFSMKRCGILIALFYTGLLPFVPLKESFLEIMLPVTMLRRFEVPTWMRVLCHVVDWFLVSPVLFKHLDKRGIQTYLWVLNTNEEFELAFEQLKVAGVMTDYPTRLKEFLNQHPQLTRQKSN